MGRVKSRLSKSVSAVSHHLKTKGVVHYLGTKVHGTPDIHEVVRAVVEIPQDVVDVVMDIVEPEVQEIEEDVMEVDEADQSRASVFISNAASVFYHIPIIGPVAETVTSAAEAITSHIGGSVPEYTEAIDVGMVNPLEELEEDEGLISRLGDKILDIPIIGPVAELIVSPFNGEDTDYFSIEREFTGQVEGVTDNIKEDISSIPIVKTIVDLALIPVDMVTSVIDQALDVITEAEEEGTRPTVKELTSIEGRATVDAIEEARDTITGNAKDTVTDVIHGGFVVAGHAEGVATNVIKEVYHGVTSLIPPEIKDIVSDIEIAAAVIAVITVGVVAKNRSSIYEGAKSGVKTAAKAAPMLLL